MGKLKLLEENREGIFITWSRQRFLKTSHHQKLIHWSIKTKNFWGASLVAQWLRNHLPMQGTRVQALVREDPTCRGAIKPVRHNY